MPKHKQPSKKIKLDTKDTVFETQRIRFFNYLRDHIATASMVSHATGIPQKNICRYKRAFQKRGLLWQVKQAICVQTKFKAWYLSTDPSTALSYQHKNVSR